MKITIVSLDNWGFNKYIVEATKLKGAETTSINFNDFRYKYPSIFHKIFNFFLKTFTKYNLKEIHLEKQINKRIKSLPKQDKILIIKSDFLSKNTLQSLKTRTNELITFINDSVSRCPKVIKTISLFDKIYSFENEDCLKYNFNKINNFIYTNIDTKDNFKEEYTVFNISSLNKRKETIPEFVRFFNSKNISFSFILYASKLNDYPTIKGVKTINKPYTIPEMLDKLKKCKIILDLQRPKQEGLSFRVFESIAFEKKLITLNKDVVNYNFYNPNNIFVVDDYKNISIPDSFFTNEYTCLDKGILEEYHVSNWVNQVFNM